MSRKSKAKFNMKGHSIPGISGFKSTSLEDGRAASSAFQMKESPLHETEAEKLEFAKAELGKEDPYAHLKWKSKGERTGVQFGMEEAMKAAMRLRGKGGEEEKKDVIDEQIDKYEGDEGTYEEYLADMEAAGVEPMSLGEWGELNLQNVDPDIEGEREDAVETYVPPVDESIEESSDEELVEETTISYEVQSGDSLSKIAKTNNMTLEELLEKNPEYKDNPNFVRKGATIKL